jgi:hypothetical protein
MKRFVAWFKGLSTTGKVLFGTTIVVAWGAIGASQATTLNSSNAANKSQQTNTQHITVSKPNTPVVTTKTETDTQSIPFTSITVQNSTLAKGTTKITTAGVNGSETLTYEITYTNGNQTSKKLADTTVTSQPVQQVTADGTYVASAPTPAPAPSCTNGTYVNSAGNTVCSPEAAPSAPAGATAQCVDGTYSFSQSRSGTCSHHGGVATWLD